MKRSLAYLLLLILIIISVSACGSKSDTVTTSTTYLSVQTRADAGDIGVTLDWQMVAGAETYNIYYIADPTGSTYSSTNKPSSATMKAGTKITSIISAPYPITLTNGTTYWFAISAVNSSGESDLSSAISATPSTAAAALPAKPENVRANAGSAEVTVTWDPVAGASSYNLYYYKFDNNLWSNVTEITGSTSGNPVIGLTNSIDTNQVIYYFFVTAVNAQGESNPSFEVYTSPSTTPPPFAPANFMGVPGPGTDDVTLTWDTVTGATSYNAYVGTAKGVTKSTGSKLSGFTSGASAAGLTPGTMYYFVVTAVNANGEGTESNEMSAMPTGP